MLPRGAVGERPGWGEAGTTGPQTRPPNDGPARSVLNAEAHQELFAAAGALDGGAN